MKCQKIDVFRKNLDDLGWESEEKPSGQIKHSLDGCVCNTYDTGTVVIQDNSKGAKYKEALENIVHGLNNINKVA
jgi:ribonuclease HIII